MKRSLRRSDAVPLDFFQGSLRLPEVEERVLAFWKDEEVFQQSLEQRKRGKPFVFYEGPPGANGVPGIHHVLSRVVKDVVLRYKTMRGYYVPRRGGWDTHGLPVELTAEKQLGITSKKQIEQLGIARFNEKCRELVWQYKGEWDRLTERIGFWLDLDNAYITYTPEYIESLWWIVKQIHGRGLLYQGHKIIPWCSRCGTGLSSHELALGYTTVKDESIFVKFKLRAGQKLGDSERITTDDAPTYVLAWTTTPWTLPGNVALAVHPTDNYYALTIKNSKSNEFIVGETLIFARSAAIRVLQSTITTHDDKNFTFYRGKDEVKGTYHLFTGDQLKDLQYEQLFKIPELVSEKSHRIYAADFVTTTDGTGVVHTAVMYGEDDYQLGVAEGLPQVHTVGADGRFLSIVPDVAGLVAKNIETEDKIIKKLDKAGNVFATESYEHEYPHCWRCSTPLLYYARSAWFVAMSKIKRDLIARNNTVDWTPKHIKDGRFGGWLKELKDWNFSRERYWGTPLPVWRCETCSADEVIGGLDELSERAGGARNQYWVMRHGEAEHNVRNVLDSDGSTGGLTKRGERAVEQTARVLAEQGIDLVISSDMTRTQQTAHMIAARLKAPVVLYDHRLREFNFGTLSGQDADGAYAPYAPESTDQLSTPVPGGESVNDVRTRTWHFLAEIERTYAGRRILLVGHDYPLWLLAGIAEGWSDERLVRELRTDTGPYLDLGMAARLRARALPRNDRGEADLHRPYVDALTITCSCGGVMRRVPEVIDVWYDSGAMPVAQEHYPFDNRTSFDAGATYPADYIAEGVDQTRGWFYTLLAVASLLGYKAPYRHVISLGLLHDKHGRKMSKSKGNAVEPWEVINQHGIDALRWYFLSVNEPGDAKNFDEAELVKGFRRLHMIAYNTLQFYELYGMEPVRGAARYTVLDRWITARLHETVAEVTAAYDRYDLRAAALPLESFVDDLSRWYVRSSRRRLQKPTSAGDYVACVKTLRQALLIFSQLAAPAMPFFAEAMYARVRSDKDSRSVHLANWPTADRRLVDKKLLAAMQLVRDLAAQGLAARAAAGIKVRQPLATIFVKTRSLQRSSELAELLAREVNVKTVTVKASLDTPVALDTVITPELVAEGMIREVARAVQELRQEAGCSPRDTITLSLTGDAAVIEILRAVQAALQRDIGAKRVRYDAIAQPRASRDMQLPEGSISIAIS